MRTAEEIVEMWRYRRDRSEGITGRLRRVRDAYNGDLVLPFAENTEPAVANLVLIGIEQKAGRIASVMPQVWFPPIKPGVEVSEKKAILRRDAVMGWWEDNSLTKMMRERARYMVAYGSAPAVLKPNIKKGIPEWHARNPLGVYPAEDLSEPLCPSDMISAFNKTYGWFRRTYPDVATRYHPPGSTEIDDFSQVVLLEYSDADQIALVYAGVDNSWEPGYQTLQWEMNNWGGAAEFLINIPNRAGRALGVIPARTTLDRLQGEFDQVLGMYAAQSKLTALEMVAVERDIFPDTYLVSRPGEQARFVSGPHDGRTGEVNIVAGGDVKNLAATPGFQTTPMIDRLERGQRITGGVPAEFGGESTSNIRTGRRGDAVLSAVVDYPILDAQEAFATALEAENRLAIAIARGWWGDRKVTFHFTERRRLRTGTYAPDEVFNETDYHKVSYPVAGADLNALVVGMGQRIGLGIMSKRSAAEMDPLVDDPELEQDRITAEALDTAMLTSLQTAATDGSLPPAVVARVSDLVRSDKMTLAKALEAALAEQAEAQAAQQQAAAAPTGLEGMMADTAAQATGQPQALPPVGEAGQGLQNLAGLMSALRKTNTRDAGRAALGGSF